MSRAWPVPHLDPDGSLAVNVPRILAVRAAELASHASVISDPTAIEGHHHARIAAKRLRYTLELFPALVGEDGEEVIARIRDLQDELGLLHDHDVRIVLIERELARRAAGSGRKAARLRPGLESMLQWERGDRADRYAAALRRWREIEASGLLSLWAGFTPARDEPEPPRAG